ncbi:hypothetical protein UFOVP14_40 [uncultured Caudovirales phage]|uniref:Uncharacterized protein n=1 Tax=uncultured Caudovirales phage TaxID=2100421 RepID=A0A6J5KHP3_9CAUD|nr:hypothetical protein UFOVP14_40 [uncultured Caudovirales phage]
MMNEKSVRGPYEGYAMSQSQVAEAMFLKQQTICAIEKRAVAKFKEIFEQRGINILDLLQD